MKYTFYDTETTGLLKRYDYALTFGVRKIARFGYENRANVFYDGTEKSYSDAATIGKISGFEFVWFNCSARGPTHR